MRHNKGTSFTVQGGVSCNRHQAANERYQQLSSSMCAQHMVQLQHCVRRTLTGHCPASDARACRSSSLRVARVQGTWWWPRQQDVLNLTAQWIFPSALEPPWLSAHVPWHEAVERPGAFLHSIACLPCELAVTFFVSADCESSAQTCRVQSSI
jgi:hypothetical protein